MKAKEKAKILKFLRKCKKIMDAKDVTEFGKLDKNARAEICKLFKKYFGDRVMTECGNAGYNMTYMVSNARIIICSKSREYTNIADESCTMLLVPIPSSNNVIYEINKMILWVDWQYAPAETMTNKQYVIVYDGGVYAGTIIIKNEVYPISVESSDGYKMPKVFKTLKGAENHLNKLLDRLAFGIGEKFRIVEYEQAELKSMLSYKYKYLRDFVEAKKGGGL